MTTVHITVSAAPTLETMACLYRAALEQKQDGDRALERVRECIARHGYTEAEVRKAVGCTEVEFK